MDITKPNKINPELLKAMNPDKQEGSAVASNDRVILQADIAYHSHPYATCPYCDEEEEVAADDCGTECSFCHKTYKYSLEI